MGERTDDTGAMINAKVYPEITQSILLYTKLLFPFKYHQAGKVVWGLLTQIMWQQP